MAVEGPNRAAAAIVFGDYLALARGGKLIKIRPGNMFVISGPGPATMRASNGADISALLAAVSGQKTKFAAKTPKGKPWPKYYGIQPTRAYPDGPFVKELYYSNAPTGLILSGATKVPPRLPPPPPPPPNLRPPNLSSGPGNLR